MIDYHSKLPYLVQTSFRSYNWRVIKVNFASSNFSPLSGLSAYQARVDQMGNMWRRSAFCWANLEASKVHFFCIFVFCIFEFFYLCICFVCIFTFLHLCVCVFVYCGNMWRRNTFCSSNLEASKVHQKMLPGRKVTVLKMLDLGDLIRSGVGRNVHQMEGAV